MGKKEYIEQFNKKGENDGIFIFGTKMELRLENGIIKMDKKMGHLKYGMEMEKSRKKRYIKKEKKMVCL